MLRLLGFDTTFFTGENDAQLVNLALKEHRIILTRDTHILERKLVTSGKVRALLIKSDNIEEQIQQVVEDLHLENQIEPFILCMECNYPLSVRTKQEIENRVPPYVWQTQNEYMECSQCQRIFWKGTHWQAMTRRLTKFKEAS